MRAFATVLREELDLRVLRSALAHVVSDTVQPAQVSLWLVEPGSRLRAARAAASA